MPLLGLLVAVAVGWAGFAYSGPAQPLLRAITIIVLAVYAANVTHSQHVNEKYTGAAQTELVVELKFGRLAELPAYVALRKAYDEELSRLWPAGPFSDEGEWLGPSNVWRFVFLGPPGTGDTVVWSDRHDTLRSDETLIYERPWHDVLKNRPESRMEPYVVLDRAADLEQGYFYRLYLDWSLVDDPDLKKCRPQLLATLPVVLLQDIVSGSLPPERREKALRMSELREDSGEADVQRDRFGEAQLYDSNHGYSVYEGQVATFRVKHYWSGA